jgi:hypothetical protein
MIPSFADNRDSRSLASRLRRRRFERMRPIFDAFAEPVSVLDIGGTVGFWERAPEDLAKRCEITLLNLSQVPTEGLKNITSSQGDGRRMPEFQENQFDVCFSNSVIEHVGTLRDQRDMAREVSRVSRSYCIQTPYRYFPVEPHFLLPLWQYWPTSIRVALYRRFRLGWMGRQPDRCLATIEVEQVRLLNRRELQWLFPDAEILPEKIGPLTKSLVAIRSRP